MNQNTRILCVAFAVLFISMVFIEINEAHHIHIHHKKKILKAAAAATLIFKYLKPKKGFLPVPLPFPIPLPIEFEQPPVIVHPKPHPVPVHHPVPVPVHLPVHVPVHHHHKQVVVQDQGWPQESFDAPQWGGQGEGGY